MLSGGALRRQDERNHEHSWFRFSVLAEDQGCHVCAAALIHPRNDVAVDLQREGRRGVAETVTDPFWENAGLECGARAKVPHIMKADPRQTSAGDMPVEQRGDRIGVKRPAIGPGPGPTLLRPARQGGRVHRRSRLPWPRFVSSSVNDRESGRGADPDDTKCPGAVPYLARVAYMTVGLRDA